MRLRTVKSAVVVGSLLKVGDIADGQEVDRPRSVIIARNPVDRRGRGADGDRLARVGQRRPGDGAGGTGDVAAKGTQRLGIGRSRAERSSGDRCGRAGMQQGLTVDHR